MLTKLLWEKPLNLPLSHLSITFYNVWRGLGYSLSLFQIYIVYITEFLFRAVLRLVSIRRKLQA